PYSGLAQVIRPDGLYQSQTRFGMYRWHIMDPVRFEQELRVTIQALGWTGDRRYLPLQDDIASVAYWYQTLPSAPFPPLPGRDYLEVILISSGTKVRLGTIQPLVAWEQLRERGALAVDDTRLSSDGYVPVQYRWLAAQMRRRSPASTGGLPWW